MNRKYITQQIKASREAFSLGYDGAALIALWNAANEAQILIPRESAPSCITSSRVKTIVRQLEKMEKMEII